MQVNFDKYWIFSRSTTFFTENKLFDGSVLNRPGPSGIVGRDVLRVNLCKQSVRIVVFSLPANRLLKILD